MTSIAKDRGFTLWELLISVSVAGVVLGIGVPGLLDWTRNSAMTATTNDLISALIAARTESLRRQVAVTLCTSLNPMAERPVCAAGNEPVSGYFVWIDASGSGGANDGLHPTDGTDGNATFDSGESILLRRETGTPVVGPVSLVADGYFVSFDSNGHTRGSVPTAAGMLASATTILLCDERGNRPATGSLSAARVLRIDPLGRSRTIREVAGIDATIAKSGLACP